MAIVNFEAFFRGGTFGFVQIRLLRNGHPYQNPIVINGTGHQQVDLEPGLYLIVVHGVAPPDGATIIIHHPSSPTTPDEFSEGPIHKNYVLTVTLQL